MVELLRVTVLVLLVCALPAIVVAGLLVTPWACVVGAPVWVTRPGARWSVWRLE